MPERVKNKNYNKSSIYSITRYFIIMHTYIIPTVHTLSLAIEYTDRKAILFSINNL